MSLAHFTGLHFFLLGVAVGIALMGVLTWLTDIVAARRAFAVLEDHPLPAMPRRRRHRDALPPETTTMIQRELKPGEGTGTCDCGRMPRLIETRGNPRPDQLATAPSMAYHLECSPCQRTTARHAEQIVAQAWWNAGLVHPITATRLSA